MKIEPIAFRIEPESIDELKEVWHRFNCPNKVPFVEYSKNNNYDYEFNDTIRDAIFTGLCEFIKTNSIDMD